MMEGSVADAAVPAEAPAEAAATPPAAAAVSESWYSSAPDDLRGYIENKGWKDPFEAVNSYRNFEKLQGVPADQLLRIPAHDAPAEAWNDIWNKLGRPTDATGYGFSAPEGDTSGFSEWAGNTFHELGIPAEMGKQLAAKFGEFQQQVAEANVNRVTMESEAGAAELKTKWGAAYDQNVAMGRNAAASLGVDGDIIDVMQDAMGLAKTIEFFQNLGAKMGEGNFVSGDSSGGSRILSPDAAKSRIMELRKDANWAKSYADGDAKARAEMKQLHVWAYPETQ